MSTKVELLPHRVNPYSWKNPRSNVVDLKRSLPYFKSAFGQYVHRIRSGMNYYWDGEYSHTCFALWCGMTGHSSERHHRNQLMATPDAKDIVCATCEGRAIGAGQAGSRQIAGQFVKFSPRT